MCAAQLLTTHETYVASCWDDNGICQVMGFFEEDRRRWMMPFRRLRSFGTIYSFESGVLVRDTADTDIALRTLLDGLLKRTSVIKFSSIGGDTLLAEHLANQKASGWFQQSSYHRATLTDAQAALDGLSKRRRKKITQKLKKLEDQGDVCFEVVSAEHFDHELENCFLELEAAGWKADTAMSANQADRQFFNTLMRDARKTDSLFAAVLRVDRKVIAITINFHQSGQAFAFKIAHDPEFAAFSPGILNEYLMLQWFAQHGMPWRVIDSGAFEGSYIDAFWPDRRIICSGELVKSRILRWGYQTRRILHRWIAKAQLFTRSWRTA